MMIVCVNSRWAGEYLDIKTNMIGSKLKWLALFKLATIRGSPAICDAISVVMVSFAGVFVVCCCFMTCVWPWKL